MTEADRHGALLEAAKALHRSLVRAALSWNVDPAKAIHNPVFMRDGALNYYSSMSTREATYLFLRETGVLEEGFNGAKRLTVPLDKIDFAADAAFSKGIDADRIVEILVGLLFDEFGSFEWSFETLPNIQMSSNPRATSINFPDEAEEMVSVLQNLQILGYVQATETKGGQSEFQWAPNALPILQRLYLAPNE